MQNALLEIFVEHLPARFFFPALEQMQTSAAEILNRHNLKFVSVRTFGTYRRLVLEIVDLASKAEDIKKEVKGPPAKLLKDDKGNYTPQTRGFAEKNGVNPQDLIIVETDKGPFIYANVKIKGESAAKLLPGIFKEIISSLTFPKNMTWEESGFKFARPIRSLIGLYGDKVVRFEIAGVKSGRDTYPVSSFGFKPIKIKRPQDYIETLRNRPQPILADPQERRKVLIKAVNAAAAKLGYKADLDEDLITETVSFTEHPVVLTGDMDLRFTALPKDLVTTVFKKQLRMFPVLDNKGKLQPHFIAVRDGISDNANEVREGFKNVMTARLSDAVFFFENDKKTGLEAMRAKLANINFIDGCGAMLDKTARVQKLAAALGGTLQKAAQYCYADLASGVVYEFPELQGYMGAVYARLEGFDEETAKAMEEFYFPLTASGRLPQTREAALLALAGKMDTLAANFAAGQIPTGSEDPFALRRAAMGAVRIMLDYNIELSLAEIINKAAGNLNPGELRAFLWQRTANIFEQKGLAADETAAVENLDKPLSHILSVAKALHAARSGEALAAVGEAAKRVGNILKKSPPPSGGVDEALLALEAEQKLYKTLLAAEGKVNLPAKDIFEEFAKFKDPLEYFFDKVMVNDNNEKLKNNRLALLGRINHILTAAVADLSKLQKRG